MHQIEKPRKFTRFYGSKQGHRYTQSGIKVGQGINVGSGKIGKKINIGHQNVNLFLHHSTLVTQPMLQR